MTDGMTMLKRSELYRLHRHITRMWVVTIFQWVTIGFLVLRIIKGH
jgi:hypothetical protein